jgi:hypothetical protein
MEGARLLSLSLLVPLLACCGPAATGDIAVDGGSDAQMYDAPGGDAGEDGGDGGMPSSTGAGELTDAEAGPDGGADASTTCASNADCPHREFCKKTACSDPFGVCSPAPTDSTCLSEPAAETCGCDHITYPSACWAAASGINVFSEGQCVLPAGPCTSQSDCGGDSYAKAVFCAPTSCGQAAGTCTRIPGACEYIMDRVCGCDGETYYNACFARMANVTVAYGGPCRSGAIVACSGPADCATGQWCVGGVCLESSGETCGSDCACGGINSPKTQECVASACGAETCSTCIFATAVPCDPDVGCPTGELCVPSAAPSDESFCVVP